MCACEAPAQDELERDAAALPARLARRHRAGHRRADDCSSARSRRRATGWHAGPLGALLLADPASRAGGLGRRARRRAPCRSEPETRETLRIEQGLPRFGVDFDGSNLPAEAGVVERAVSFTKGCYIGQEPIVRLAHRGHANRELRRLRARRRRPTLPATLLDGEREVGRLTSSAGLPEGGAAALGYVRRTVEDGAALVALDARGERVAALDAGRVAAGRP